MDDAQLPEIERTVDLPAAPDRVWERIVDGAWSEEWMGVRLEPRRGGTVTVPGRDVLGTVEEVDPGRSITWSWREPDGDPSQVTITLEPAGGSDDGCRVTVVERLLEYRFSRFEPFLLSAA